MTRTSLGLGPLLALVTAVAVIYPPTSSASSGRHHDAAPAVGVVIELPPDGVGQARLATLASVLRSIAVPGMTIGVYLDAGPSNGSELLYDHAPPLPPSTFTLARPKLPHDSTGLEREAYAVALKTWKAAKHKEDVAARSSGTSAVSAWASRRAGGLLAAGARSDPAHTCSTYAASLYRAGLFFSHETGSPRVLVVIGDLVHCAPPTPRLLDYQLEGARVILAGLSAVDPMKFRARSSAWRGFFTAERTGAPVVLPHGLDTAAAISALIKP